MDIPILGEVKRDFQFDDLLRSNGFQISFLGNNSCEFVLEEYEDDMCKAEFHAAIKNFLELNVSVLKDVEKHVFQYYQDILVDLTPADDWYVEIASPADVWKHVKFGRDLMVSRRYCGDEAIYISLECECDWEKEHGLQIVFKEGMFINKIGGFDGHLTNSDAYGDDSLEDVIYKS